MAAVVTLVPWRPGDPRRERWWESVRPHLEGLGFPLFTGDAPGESWARAAACNAAARAAGSWEIALVADADTILDPAAVALAIERVEIWRGAARPHDHRWMLNSVASKILLAHGPEKLEPRMLRGDAPGGGALVVHREAFEEVGGYDERFVGWGYEDSAMNIELATARRWERIPGNSWHLSHPQANILSAPARANRMLLEELRAERRGELARASARAGYDLNLVL